MTEQTAVAPSKTPTEAPVEAQEPERPSNAPPPGFGGRTDAHVGVSLGLAPVNFSKPGQVSDDSAPLGLADDLADPEAFARAQAATPPVPAGPPEHWHVKQMRLLAQAARETKALEEAEESEKLKRSAMSAAEQAAMDARLAAEKAQAKAEAATKLAEKANRAIAEAKQADEEASAAVVQAQAVADELARVQAATDAARETTEPSGDGDGSEADEEAPETD